MHEDPYDLTRFTLAQVPVWQQVRAELQAGRKRTHWMWFIFPQLAGLGHSATSRHYALASLGEATAYLADPVLGPRLLEATQLVTAAAGRSLQDIFGSPDDLKFHSCMTLFARVGGSPVFTAALQTFHAGREDAATVRLLS